PKGVTDRLLEQVMQRLVGVHTKRRAIMERVQMANGISIEESISRIRALLEGSKRFAFHHLLGKNADRAERIVHFLALLELVKQRHVRVMQKALFEEIQIAAV
ncbi:MAG: segregation/condensation protein A, partial [Patescibacteria group bacterium]